MGFADLIVQFEPQARKEVGQFFGIDKSELQEQIEIRISSEYGAGWGTAEYIGFGIQNMERDLGSRERQCVQYTQEEYVRSSVYEEVAHHLEQKFFGQNRQGKCQPFQQMLFTEFFGSFGISLSGLLDKEIIYRRKEAGNLRERLEYLISKEMSDEHHYLDSYNDLESRLNIFSQIKLLKSKLTIKRLEELSSKLDNVSLYDAWKTFYNTVYPKRKKHIYISGDSHNAVGDISYIYARLTAERLLSVERPVQPMLKMSFSELKYELEPILRAF